MSDGPSNVLEQEVQRLLFRVGVLLLHSLIQLRRRQLRMQALHHSTFLRGRGLNQSKIAIAVADRAGRLQPKEDAHVAFHCFVRDHSGPVAEDIEMSGASGFDSTEMPLDPLQRQVHRAAGPRERVEVRLPRNFRIRLGIVHVPCLHLGSLHLAIECPALQMHLRDEVMLLGRVPRLLRRGRHSTRFSDEVLGQPLMFEVGLSAQSYRMRKHPRSVGDGSDSELR